MAVEKSCENCGKLFTSRASEGRKFCGIPCMRSFESKHGRSAARVAPVAFACKNCGSGFTMKPSYLTAYRKKFGKDPLYCSMPCSDAGRRKDSDEKHKTACKNCGEEFYRSRRKGSGTVYREQQLCSRECKNEWVSKVYRQKHGLPQITRRIKRGYVYLRFPAANGRDMHEMLEHRHVMEQFLGRPLTRAETIHHKSGDKTDNRLINLELRAGNHGPGQAVEDIMAWCIEMIRKYPAFAEKAGLSAASMSDIPEHALTPPSDLGETR